MHHFLDFPHRGAPMTGETIERTELSERAELFFGKRHAPLEIIQRMKLSILALPNEFFRVFLTQPVHHAKSQSHCVIGDHHASTI